MHRQGRGSAHRPPRRRVTTAPEQLAAWREDRAASSEAVEDYVRAILHTARGPRLVASTTGVAEVLGVTPASVSSMFKKLARLELVAYLPYRGVSLTSEGTRLARRLAHRHRLIETFLTQALGMTPQRAHLEADRLEHHVSAELEALIARHLSEPPAGAPREPTSPQSSVGADATNRSDWASA